MLSWIDMTSYLIGREISKNCRFLLELFNNKNVPTDLQTSFSLLYSYYRSKRPSKYFLLTSKKFRVGYSCRQSLPTIDSSPTPLYDLYKFVSHVSIETKLCVRWNFQFNILDFIVTNLHTYSSLYARLRPLPSNPRFKVGLHIGSRSELEGLRNSTFIVIEFWG